MGHCRGALDTSLIKVTCLAHLDLESSWVSNTRVKWGCVTWGAGPPRGARPRWWACPGRRGAGSPPRTAAGRAAAAASSGSAESRPPEAALSVTRRQQFFLSLSRLHVVIKIEL